MSTVPFYKMEASANDFVVIDNRRKVIRDTKKFARFVCARHTGIGSDGVLLIEPSRKANFKMRIVNADGSEAQMCGNGSRCVALYARKVLKFPSKFSIETLAGVIDAEWKGEVIKVRLVEPKDFRPLSDLEAGGRKISFYFINTSVPHAVIFVDHLKDYPVSDWGEKIRFHERFKPAGTNVNFVQVTGEKSLFVRTYERGVGETQACGTGATASAIVSVVSGRAKAPVRVRTRGGEILKVDFQRQGSRVKNVCLEGKARFVFEGKIKI